MRNFLIKRKIEITHEKNKRNKKFLNFNSIKNVLIVFNLENWDDVSDVVDDLVKNKKNVTLWSIKHKDQHLENSTFPGVRIIDAAKEKNWTQTLAKTTVEEFGNLQYDTFMDLSTYDDPILNYLVASNTSNFCIGSRERDIKIYDFVILKDEAATLFSAYEEMKHYLNNNFK